MVFGGQARKKVEYDDRNRKIRNGDRTNKTED
jgi:hypothetical protein